MININKKLLFTVVGVVIVLGLVSLLFINKGGNAPTNDSSGSQNKEAAAEKFTGSLKDAIAMGVGMKCSYEIDGASYEGYVKGKNYSGQVKTAEGQIGKIIVKDDCVWSWSTDSNNQGVKICYTNEDVVDAGDVWSQEEVADPGIEYNCTATAVSDSEFTPPSTINFIDTEDMMKQYGI